MREIIKSAEVIGRQVPVATKPYVTQETLELNDDR